MRARLVRQRIGLELSAFILVIPSRKADAVNLIRNLSRARPLNFVHEILNQVQDDISMRSRSHLGLPFGYILYR